ncbi:MAG: NCS2 family permease [Acidobacteriota bacterium]|nr:NCS2 family permease [Acidobacteriota bacterium]
MDTESNDFWGLRASGSNVSRELSAGLTTFLTMSYILFVNPTILGEAIVFDGAGPQLMTATALAAAFGSLTMGLLSRYPFALAPGMGLNAYFAYTVVLGQGVPWQTALGAVFLSGLLFLAISVSGARQALINAIPRGLKFATTAGIGGFLAMIGMKNGGLVVDHPSTLVTMGDLSQSGPLLVLFGLVLTAILLARGIRAAVLIGILATAVVAMLFRAPVYQGAAFAGFSDGIVAPPAWPDDLFLAMDIPGALKLGAPAIVFTFLFVDFFDSAGTLIGLSEKAGILDKHGNLPHSRAAFSTDALATSVGAALGTSSTTCYIESAAGIEDGGRTGLTAVTVAVLFCLSLFLWPLASAVPGVATAPALIVIGAMMMFSTTYVDWRDYGESVPALLTIFGMPFTYSITNGISLGLVSYCLINTITGHHTRIHWMMYLLSGLLVLRFAYLVGG